MSPERPEPIKLFCAYAREDEQGLKQLDKHLALLQRQGLIKSWYDRQILPGTEWQSEIEKQLTSAQIIVLLVSSDFLASDYCYSNEMERALERYASGEALVIPVILRPVDLRRAPFAHLECLPRNSHPITMWSSLDEAFLDVAQGIRAAVNRLQTQPPLEREQPKERRLEETLKMKERWLREGSSFYHAGNYERAIAAYEQVLRLDPDATYTYIHKSQALGRLGRYQEALNTCEKALDIDRFNAYAHSTRGAALHKLGRYQEALTACEEAIHLDPCLAHAYCAKAAVLLDQGRYQEVLDACNRAIHLNPYADLAHGQAGAALLFMGNPKESLVATEQAIRLDPYNPAFYVNKGNALLNFNRFREALAAYEQAIRLDSNCVLAYIAKATALANLGYSGAAFASIEYALRLDPHNMLAHQVRRSLCDLPGYLPSGDTHWFKTWLDRLW